MLMARANGLGRLIPTPALNKVMLHRVVGGLEDPYLNRILYLYNKPSTVTVTVTAQPSWANRRANDLFLLLHPSDFHLCMSENFPRGVGSAMR